MKYVFKVDTDDFAESPRKIFDNMSTMVCWHNRYTLGDEEFSSDYASSSIEAFAEYIDDKYSLGIIDDYLLSEYKRVWKWIRANIVCKPLYLYDHSGITMSVGSIDISKKGEVDIGNPFSCHWDSGCVGFAYVARDRALSEYGGNIFTKKIKDNCSSIIDEEVKKYDYYLVGDVFCLGVAEVEDEFDLNDIDVDNLDFDMCCGYYGREYLNDAIIDHATNHKTKEVCKYEIVGDVI